MSRQIFIGLPVRDLPRAIDFFTGLGFTPDPSASDERSAGLVVNEHTMLMLNAESYFREFTRSAVADPTSAREVTLGLSADSVQQVDETVERAVAGGGRAMGGPVRQGPMYMRAFLDLDGHRWSVIHFAVPG